MKHSKVGLEKVRNTFVKNLERRWDLCLAAGRVFLRRPLRAAEIAPVTASILAAGTFYCAAYCRIAQVPMHAGNMPLWLSAYWAGTGLLPWAAAFEAFKRAALSQQTALRRLRTYAMIAVVTATVTFVASNVDFHVAGSMPGDWRVKAANELQPLLMFMIVAALWSAERGERVVNARAPDEGSLPPIQMIEWIRAAGNYIEIRCGDRLLIRRMTLRSAEALTRQNDLIRVHRSLIVRGQMIVGYAGRDRRRIRLSNGEVIAVGASYRRAVERFVPSSS